MMTERSWRHLTMFIVAFVVSASACSVMWSPSHDSARILSRYLNTSTPSPPRRFCLLVRACASSMKCRYISGFCSIALTASCLRRRSGRNVASPTLWKSCMATELNWHWPAGTQRLSVSRSSHPLRSRKTFARRSDSGARQCAKGFGGKLLSKVLFCSTAPLSPHLQPLLCIRFSGFRTLNPNVLRQIREKTLTLRRGKHPST